VALQQILSSIDIFLYYRTDYIRTLGPSNVFTLLNGCTGKCVRLNRLLAFECTALSFISFKRKCSLTYIVACLVEILRSWQRCVPPAPVHSLRLRCPRLRILSNKSGSNKRTHSNDDAAEWCAGKGCALIWQLAKHLRRLCNHRLIYSMLQCATHLWRNRNRKELLCTAASRRCNYVGCTGKAAKNNKLWVYGTLTTIMV